jgi:tetratricopeptide (TPR) repeat protein
MRGQKKLRARNISFVSIIVFTCAAIALLNIPSFPAFATSAEMYYAMGQKYMEEGNFDMAALAFEEAVKLVPDWPEAHNALGEAYVQLLRFEDAVAEFDKAIELKNDYTEARTNRRRTIMSVERYKPMKGSRLSRWHKFAILGGITAIVALTSALIVYFSS